MTTVTVSLSDEEMRRLEELSKQEGLTVEQMVRLGTNDFIGNRMIPFVLQRGVSW